MRGRHIIQRLLCLRTITAEVIHDERSDTYYLRGNSFPIKDKLKRLGFRWDSIKKMWYTKKQDVAEKGEQLLEKAGPPADREPTPRQMELARDLVDFIGKDWNKLYKGPWEKPPTRQEIREMGFAGISKFIDELLSITKVFATRKQVDYVQQLFEELDSTWTEEKPSRDELLHLTQKEISDLITRLKVVRKRKKEDERPPRTEAPATSKQIDYALTLLARVDWFDTEDGGSFSKPTREEVKHMSKQDISFLIDNLKSAA